MAIGPKEAVKEDVKGVDVMGRAYWQVIRSIPLQPGATDLNADSAENVDAYLNSIKEQGYRLHTVTFMGLVDAAENNPRIKAAVFHYMMVKE